MTLDEMVAELGAMKPDDLRALTGQPYEVPVDPVAPNDMGDRACRAEAMQLAIMVYGYCPDIIDRADEIAEYIMTGDYVPHTRPVAEVVYPFPEPPSPAA